MFTGLVEGTGRIEAIERTGSDISLVVTPLFPLSDGRVGESISVDGVCLTVTRFQGKSFWADVSDETLSRSTLGTLKPGDRVNLERALRLGDRLGGHLVSGHVDGMGKILKKEQRQRSWFLKVGVESAVSRYLIEKGSIAVDGVSLTVNRCDDRSFEVNIIPQTGKETVLLEKRIGDPVNLETDMIGKYVEKFFKGDRSGQSSGSGIDRKMLMEHGFGD
jgi:riboflavin synthase